MINSYIQNYGAFGNTGDELIAANRTVLKTCSDSACFSRTKIQARRKVIWAHLARAVNRRRPRFPEEPPKARPAQQPYKRWLTPPIVRILQYPAPTAPLPASSSPHNSG